MTTDPSAELERSDPAKSPRRMAALHDFWVRRRRLFWMLHSAWALLTGTAVVIIARERYHLVLWVVLFLVFTWLSTLFFGRGAGAEPAWLPGVDRRRAPPTMAHEVTSYFTRVMYQETLFFLLPFYTYSTVLDSPDVLFLGLLGGLAAFSCIDLVFDRWLRTRPIFGLTFFAVVAFAALNLLLPLVFGLRLRFATPAASLLALAAAVPLAHRTIATPGGRLRLALAAVAFVALPVGFPGLVPPVPLRLQRATFSSSIDQRTLALGSALSSPVSSAVVGPVLVVVVEVFAPSALPAQVVLDWTRDGISLHQSRDIEIVARRSGFRVWDSWRSPTGNIPPGKYEVVLRTQGNRVFGVAKLTVVGP
ncbi:MAG: DUF5924 family protein [Gemmatimonadaceae bacterium]|nr:DUF5924 family protein [Gemmatimonadaceae bacterium]